MVLKHGPAGGTAKCQLALGLPIDKMLFFSVGNGTTEERRMFAGAFANVRRGICDHGPSGGYSTLLPVEIIMKL